MPDPQLVDDVIDAMRRRRGVPGVPFPYELLADRYPADVVLAVMDELETADVTESGVSLRTGWVRDYLPDIEVRIQAFKDGREYPSPD